MNAPLPSFSIGRAFDLARIAEINQDAGRRGVTLLSALTEQTGGDRAHAQSVLAETLGLPHIRLADFAHWQPAFELMPFAEALRHNCLLLRDGDRLRLVIPDPFDDNLHAWAADYLAEACETTVADPDEIVAYLARCEESVRAFEQAAAGAEGSVDRGGHVEDLSLRAVNEDNSPVVRLVRSTLHDALKTGASDVHFESSPTGLCIKYRIDGVLSQIGSAEGAATAEQVISRIKVLSELDISERRVPQDGRFKATVQGRNIDFRVSIMPSIFGEDAVLRVLDKRALTADLEGLRLETLGFGSEEISVIRRLASESYGMVLVTGPTGSGKTTTLYAALTEINLGRDKIITIEDPVEYQLRGVLQIPVNENKGLTFARGLRSILRHDPDKIMVGEIRDPETAQIAVQAALTGHLVFTTVHANNVFDVIGRFLHMEVDPYSLVSALNGVVAQRLLRVLCISCAVPAAVPDEESLRQSGLTAEQVTGWKFMAETGCAHCRGSGYKGRQAVAEILMFNDEIREMVVAREPIRKLKDAARRNGTHYLRDVAMRLVQNGTTTLDEVNRVTFVA
jgi:general secretion pathway protein E